MSEGAFVRVVVGCFILYMVYASFRVVHKFPELCDDIHEIATFVKTYSLAKPMKRVFKKEEIKT